MNLLIIEPSANGHRFHYLNWAVRAFLKNYQTVYIGTSHENVSHPLLLKLQSEFTAQIHVISIPGKKIRSKFLIRESQNWVWFNKIFNMTAKKHNVDFVFVPYLDHIFYALALFGSPFGKTSFSGIIMAPTFHHRECGVVRPGLKKDIFEKTLFSVCFRPDHLTTVFTIDPFLCQSKYSNKTLCYLPDPYSESGSIDQSTARKKLALTNADKIVLVFGLINSRKGVKTLLEAVEEFDLDVHVLLVGRHDPATLNLLETKPARTLFSKNKLTSINDYISADMETFYYSAADIIWLGYEAHYGMSGVLVKAAACDRNILACREGLIGHLTETYHLGVATSTDCPEKVAKAINQLVKNNIMFDKSKRKRFVQQHSLEQFSIALTNQLE